MSKPNDRSRNQPTGRFACRAILREALTTSEPLGEELQAHVDVCAFCAARMQTRDRWVPLLQQRPELPVGSAGATASMMAGIYNRVVDRAENGPLGHLLAGAVPPVVASEAGGGERGSGDHANQGWPESLLESSIARQAAGAPPAVAPTSWTRVKDSILDEVASGLRRGTRHHRWSGHWWLGLLGTALAAGVVVVLVQQERPAPPSITFQDIANLTVGSSIPSVDFAVVRRGATR
jgi:hypothetical protein